MYLYVFENGESQQSPRHPSEDDIKAVEECLLQIWYFDPKTNSYYAISPLGDREWVAVENLPGVPA